MFLGIHASALTVMEALFDMSGRDAYKLFLEKFVDGNTPDTKFSDIAYSIHEWRNILAHQWLGSAVRYTVGVRVAKQSGYVHLA